MTKEVLQRSPTEGTEPEPLDYYQGPFVNLAKVVTWSPAPVLEVLQTNSHWTSALPIF